VTRIIGREDRQIGALVDDRGICTLAAIATPPPERR
jgi:hypothetical protein